MTQGNIITIPQDCDVVFVSDAFSHQYLGGAELTTDAIIDGSNLNVFRLNSKDINVKTIGQATDKFWIFGNFFGMDLNLIPVIVSNLNYSIVEYDYKYCKYRSPEKHKFAENVDCDCHENVHGKIVSSFFYGAECIFWMGERQRDRYHNVFPFLQNRINIILSSVFSTSFFDKIEDMKNKEKDDTWVIIGSSSWIKGVAASESHCRQNDLKYEIVENLSHEDVLKKLSVSKGLVFLPVGGDTCPRIVIEAKLLGCELEINENVEHASEKWFCTNDLDSIENHLRSAPQRFWPEIEKIMNKIPTVSGYTTTLNCVSQKYPFQQSILSMINFCDQIVVVDGGSDDGTWEALESLSSKYHNLIIEKRERDWSDSRFAVFDGLQKAYARSLCTGDFCWQQDSDEIVHEDDVNKVKKLVRDIPKSMNLVALPIIEYWGGHEKVRVDVNPWKWRLSRNRKHITHGIPKHLRRHDEDGKLYAMPGTDGCDYIDTETHEIIPCANFYTNNIHNIKISALSGDKKALEAYENWFNNAINNLPGVHHYSWFDLDRKIKTYKNYWSQHWQSLYNIPQEDRAENNMFFDKPWSEVTDYDVKNLADRLENEMGGWVFHRKIDFLNPTPSLDIEIEPPEIMKSWCKGGENV